MAKRFDEMPEFQAKLPRTGHSLSHNFGFTAACGHLLPVFHDFLNPGETVTLGFDYLLRTQPLDAATMGKLKTHSEYFFVPMQLLYQGFSDWYYGIREEFSSRFTGSDGSLQEFGLPLVNLSALFGTLYTYRNNSYAGSGNLRTYLHESCANNAYRLFDMLGFRPKRILDGIDADNSLGQVFPYQLLAYNCIYQYYYRLDTRELFNPSSFNVDRYYNVPISSNSLSAYSYVHYRPVADDYYTDVKVSPIVDVLNLNNKTAFEVATQYLTRNSFSGSNILTPGDIGNTSSGPFDASNYSNTILTQFGFKRNQVDITNQTTSPNNNYHVDGGNIPNEGNTAFRDATPGKLLDSSGDPVEHDHTYRSSSYLNGLDIGTANIRAMFATEKLWSVTGRAKKTYDDQTFAHFGFKVPHDVKHQISCFGHDTSEIKIGEVISTANTGASGSPLGEIAGKGYGAQGGKKHKFTAPCHGVVMVIFSIVPEEYYTGTFLKANKFSAREDLFTPEYDHLGMQPVFDYEIDGQSLTPQGINSWQYRYQQWKRRYNRTTSIFDTSRGSLSSWIHTIRPYFGSVLSNSLPNTSQYLSFLHGPTELDDIFLVNYNTAYSTTFATDPSAVYDTDPFVVNSHIDCVKVSTMSDYSLPRLDA